MPYIKNIEREAYASWLGQVPQIQTPGELNYLICQLALKYMQQHGMRYQSLNDVTGAIENAKLEIYRRVAAPYEDEKIAQNGDVFSFP